MNILVAPDKFKHSLSSFEACEAVTNGLLKASKDFIIRTLPLADGGDGLSEVIEHYISANKHAVVVSDPLFRPVNSQLLVSEDGETAFIEMAKASGLLLLKPEEYRCMNTTSLGTGELVREAIRLKVKEVIIGIGGSATNDGGMGMAVALGYRFLDRSGAELKPVGENLVKVAAIDNSQLIELKDIRFTVACDVKNPLTGNNGATMVYAKQKGASPTEISQLEEGMQHFSDVLKSYTGKDIAQIEGAGAAGGLGAGCMAFLNADVSSGIALVLKLSNAEDLIRNADIVITGEGKIDEQSLNGKAISGIAELCRKYNKPLIAFCGTLALNHQQLNTLGVQQAYSINSDAVPIEEAFKNASRLLSEAAFFFGRKLLQQKAN